MLIRLFGSFLKMQPPLGRAGTHRPYAAEPQSMSAMRIICQGNGYRKKCIVASLGQLMCLLCLLFSKFVQPTILEEAVSQICECVVLLKGHENHVAYCGKILFNVIADSKPRDSNISKAVQDVAN
ncbi:MAG: hypothetical protein KF774_21455, partial [Planctomyces sp.]|nr:hypothetical protein [Planctomyces sp.]